MKQFFFAVSVLVITTAANAQVKPKTTTPAKPKTTTKAIAVKPAAPLLKTLNDSFSYALGSNVANNLKSQGINGVGINYAMVQKAMTDGFKGTPSLLDQAQASRVIQVKLQEGEKVLQAEAAVKATKVKASGDSFLLANSKRPGVITLPDGLQYEVLKKAPDSSKASPKLEDTAVAHYIGTLIDGTEFDNSYKRGEPLSVPVSGVILGWTEALQLMHVGDKWKVYIPSALGYGDRGAGNTIPGGSALVFEMELLGIKSAAAKAEEPKKQ
ncbi:FKBP-type peptidyl-prolyl cis-trans isomerase [Ferruginibacter albus]|uniref:FKBP-type peptidyl-prolyl cis-trans isomerase n=1 Tax=Ferruginibacter albus TaxID=2875540 RepID=UPI001CC72F94|nr:FKBP-type peptidyl-prolyl cis-trans isomerase [Ferruginibacter albus]UAY51374.1 FKBP-type peptidyl-prolyl cis-trans isomerase [Ferruginibacter albus]